MSVIDGLRHRLSVLFRGGAYTREQDAELRLHLELESQQHPVAGQELARRKLGNLSRIREDLRSASGLAWLDHFRQDVTYGFRGLRRSPGFTITVLLTLSLGVGANAALFSFLDRIFFRDPPGVEATASVKRIYLSEPDPFGAPGSRRALQRLSYPEFAAVAGAIGGQVDLAADIPPSPGAGRRNDRPEIAFVTGNYFATLGVRPAVGRFFAAEESRIETDPLVAVISHSLWKRRYRLDPGILDKTIEFSRTAYRIIGVAREGFDGVDVNATQLFLPLSAFPVPPDKGRPWYADGGNWTPLRPIVRIPVRASERPLMARASVAYRGATRDIYRSDTTRYLVAGPIVEARGPAAQSKEIEVSTRMAGVTLAVMLIACANIACLLLVRATRRTREIAVRLALGVGRARLFRQMLTESLLLATLGCACALFVAYWGGTLLRTLLLPGIVWAEPALELRVIVFTVATTMVVSLVAGLAPAFHALRTTFHDALRSSSKDPARKSRVRMALLVAQTTLSLVLLIGAGLFVRTYYNIRTMPLGFDTARMIYGSTRASDSLGQRVTDALSATASRMASVPGVHGTALATSMQMAGGRSGRVVVPGRDSLGFGVARTDVGSTYFATMAMQFLGGRAFTRSEAENGAPVVVVNRTLAMRVWPNDDAVGKCIVIDPASNTCAQIVGVVADSRRLMLFEPQPPAQVFIPLATTTGFWRPTVVIVNADPDHAVEIAQRLKAEMRDLLPADASIVVDRIATMIEPQYRPWMVGAQLFGAFGILALVVAAIGIYAVVAYWASQRAHEMGVRIALGARGRDVLDLVVGEGMRIVAMGIVIGIIATFALSRLVASYLFGVTANDPYVMIGAASVLAGAGLIASIVPAWRAARADPMTSLRAD